MQVFALDGIEQIAQFHDFSRVTATEVDLDVGSWSLEVPLGEASSAAARLADATWGGIEIYDPETRWRFGGYLTEITIARDTTTRVVFKGNDFQTDLQNRLDWPDITDPQLWWSQTYGGTIPLTSDAHNSLYSNGGDGALAFRRIPHLAFGADPGAGTPKARRIKGLPLLEVFRGMFLGEAYTCRLRLTRDPANLAFGANGSNEIRFETPARPTAEARLSTDVGNIASVVSTEQADTATYLIAMGADKGLGGGERYVSVAQGGGTSWRNRYIETFSSRAGTDIQANLDDEASTELASRLRQRTIEIGGAEVDGFGQTIDVGWNAEVDVGSSFGSATVELPVVASTLTFDTDEGWRRTIDVGVATTTGPAAIYDHVRGLARQVRNIETELGST